MTADVWPEDITDRHAHDCTVWHSQLACDCGADNPDPRNLYLPMPATAARLDLIEPVELPCDEIGEIA